MTTQGFRPLTQAEQIFHDLVWQPMIQAGESWLETEVPALNLPVLKQIDEGVIGLVADWAFAQLCLFVDVTAIKLVNAAHQSAYDRASLELAVIAQEKGINSNEFKTARAAATAALVQFTRLPGS